MVINRYVKASPLRTSSETWAAIKTMIVGNDSGAKAEFEKVNGVLGAHISDEKLKDSPLILVGSSPRVRVFCYYNDDALEKDASESPIPAYNFKEIDWKVMVPIYSGDEWVGDELKKRSSRFITYDANEGYTGDHVEKSSSVIEIDMEGLANL